MSKFFKITTAISFVLTVIMSALFCWLHLGVYLSLAITFGTIFYHFGARLLVGFLFDISLKNRVDYTKWWFKVHKWENKVFKFLKVKKWKGKLPTYSPDSFLVKKHSLPEIAQAMCQAELVHEVNALISFLPLIATIWFGSFYVFLITSICGAIFDLIFVVAQRYNRQRIVSIIQRQNVKQVLK